nr:MAG TPA: hypothetical protein [Caudoviricetes sp.]
MLTFVNTIINRYFIRVKTTINNTLNHNKKTL